MSIFGNTLCVVDYEKALQFSKEFKFDCITQKGEIVYAGGFLTR